MNGYGEVPGWWTTQPNTCPVALFRSGQGPVDSITCGGVPLFTHRAYGAVGPMMYPPSGAYYLSSGLG